MVIAVLLLPTPIAERYTSPTQDGQYLLNPLKAYGFLFTLLTVGDSAVLGSSGEALERAKTIYSESIQRPVKVELLYLTTDRSYLYLTREGRTLRITRPPRLVWEIWGRTRDRTALEETVDVIGFLDYRTGEQLGGPDWIALGLTGA